MIVKNHSFYGIIYKVTNLMNGKMYIGQTVNFTKRKQHHDFSSRNDSKTYFHRAIKKYGKNNFNWCIVDFATSQGELDSKEEFWIKFYKTCIHDEPCNGYNMTFGGENINSGELHYLYGKHHSEERKIKIGKKLKGKFIKEKSSRAKPVIQLTLDGKFVSEYPTALQGAEAINSRGSNITACCKGKAKSHRGFLWLYKDSYNEINVSNLVKINNEKGTGGVFKDSEHHNSKHIVKLTKDGQFVKYYETIKNAYSDIGVSKNTSSISACCNGKQKTAYGFKWMYKNDYEKLLIKGE